MLKILMTKENKRYYLIGLLWFVYGYLCWLSALYLFSYGVSNAVLPVSRFVNSTIHSYFIAIFTNFMMFHITDFLLAFSLAVILSRASGKRKLWTVLFIAGAVGRSLYGDLTDFLSYREYYSLLPQWFIIPLAGSLIAGLIVVPSLTWIGTFVGNKYWKEKTT